MSLSYLQLNFFFFDAPAPTEIYTLSLHDALPISTATKWFTANRGLAVAIVSAGGHDGDRKSTRLNSSHVAISYAVFCLKKKKNILIHTQLLNDVDILFNLDCYVEFVPACSYRLYD